MSKADPFWHYAEEAMLAARQAETEKEKRAPIDLARAWAQAALQCENAAGPGARKPASIGGSPIAPCAIDRPLIGGSPLVFLSL